MIAFLSRHLIAPRHRPRARRGYYRARKFLADCLFPYTGQDLRKALARVGVREGDTLFVHSSFSVHRGFQGGPQDIIAGLLDAVGARGNLLMPSMTYTTSSYEYLMKREIFHLTRTPSRMGLLTELFRRKKGVVRSMNPVHPLLVFGRDAVRLTGGHEHCAYSCGKGSPFEKFRDSGGKILFFDVPFNTFTFIHFLEDRLREALPFALYHPDPLPAVAVDSAGTELVVPAYVFSEQAVRRRRPAVLEDALDRKRTLRRARIGLSRLMLVTAEDAENCMDDLARRNRFIYRGA